MVILSLSSSFSSYNNKHCLGLKSLQSHQTRVLFDTRKQSISSISYNPLRLSIVMNSRNDFLWFCLRIIFCGVCCRDVGKKTTMIKKRHGFGAVCYSGPLTPRNLQWVSTISTAVLMLARGTAIHKPFLAPLFALQAPASIVSWIKGEYGIWTAFLALLVRLFFFIPGELEFPFITLLLIIVCPYQITRLRGTQEGVIFSLLIAAYLAFQHFSRAGSLRKAFDQGSIIATLATICIVAVPCLLLI